MRLARTIVTGLILTPLFAAAAGASEWMHNGSVMTLVDAGNDRAFVYKEPRTDLSVVKPGTVLFKGRRDKFSYSGYAATFSTKCGEMPFAVSGDVSKDERNVTLKGDKPIRDANCNVTSYAPETLEFIFIDPPASSATPPTPPITAPKNTVETTPSTPSGMGQASGVPRIDSVFQILQPTPVVPEEPATPAKPDVEHVDLPTIVSDKNYTEKPQDLYDNCSAKWNRDKYMSLPDGKALVAGWSKKPDGGSRWSCFLKTNSNNAVEETTKSCKEKFDECYTFARGNNLTKWAEEQKNAILNGARAREEKIRIQDASHRDLPTYSNKAHRTKTEKMYDKCSEMWNESRYGGKSGGKAMVAGYRTEGDKNFWTCYWDNNVNKSNGEVEASLTQYCYAHFTDCLTFARGDSLTAFGESEKNAILDGSRRYWQKLKEKAAEEPDKPEPTLPDWSKIFSPGSSRHNPIYSPPNITRERAPCRVCAPGNRNAECCKP